jgi:hypothetical protein
MERERTSNEERERITADDRERADEDLPALVPNATTIAAMNEPNDKLASFKTIAELMADLHADD